MKHQPASLILLILLYLGCSEPLVVQAPDDSAESLSVSADALSVDDGVASKSAASGKVKATAALMEVEILESNSDFVNHIYLVSPGPEVFLGTDDDWGMVTALPAVRRNQELIFEIRVHDPGDVDTGIRWQTGPPSRNPDHERHAMITNNADGSINVNFEDIDASGWGVGDEPNFVDAVFVVRPQ